MAVLEDFAGSGQKRDGVVKFAEDLPEDLFQFPDGGVGDVFFVKSLVRQVELVAERLTVKRRFAVGGEDAVSGLQDRGEVVDEGAGPIEDQVSNHFFIRLLGRCLVF